MKKRICKGCKTEYTPSIKGQKSCNECRMLITEVKHTTDINEFERAREEYNRRHATHYKYGEFVNYIESIYKSRLNATL